MPSQMLHTDSRTAPAHGGDLHPAPVSAGRTIQSVDRAIDVLEVLAQTGEKLPLKEIARKTGLNVSTCHHLLATLVNRGYVGRSRFGRLYFIGGKVSALFHRRPSHFNVVELAMPALRRLNRETGETVHLSVLQSHRLLRLAWLDSSHPVGVGASQADVALAAHATATGKAVLAWLPETETARVLTETGLRPFTDHTITDRGTFMRELHEVRRNGYASDREEFRPGVRCLGSAVRDASGAVIAAVSCCLPEMRATPEVVELIRLAVCDCTQSLSERLASPD